MSDRLRRTSADYDQEINQLQGNITQLENSLAEAKKNLDDLKSAKKILDDQIAKLPKPAVPGPAEQSPSGTRATGGK